jgi:hypothetical protein
MAPSDTGNLKNEYIIQVRHFNILKTDNKFKGNIDQWTHSTIIIGYSSYLKPMDNGSMITWPMGVSGCENPRKDGGELDRWAENRRCSGWVRVI